MEIDTQPKTQPSKILDQLESLMGGIMQSDAAWCRPRIRSLRRKLAGSRREKEPNPGSSQDSSSSRNAKASQDSSSSRNAKASQDRSSSRNANASRDNKLLQAIIDRCTRSAEQSQRRKQRLPQPQYDDALPITAHREEIIAAIKKHQVLVIAGETGSGKTTQIPKMCLDAGRGVRGLIGCTQPRRIAANAMAERVAEELKSTLGDLVGYQVRFRENLHKDGLIKFMTDGILLAETTHDHNLNAYDTIIIDEAHERSLNIDFLLGYLKQLLSRRPDLRIIITSATIDTAKFAKHFNDAQVIEVSGRGYPVEVEYLPIDEDNSTDQAEGRDLYAGIAKAVKRLNKIDARGDTLVFLSGEREIHEARDFLQKQNFRHTEVLPLFARLPVADQRKVFHPGGARRIILSTNVAETSLTVPRIKFVIDSGLVRISRYSHRSRVQRLPIEPVSQASANQRKGRCGRLGPGTCIRLYSEEDFDSRPEFTEPEILRTSLASVILRMLTTRLGSVEDFPFLDAPAPRMINDAYHLLFELNAIDQGRKPTPLGQQLSRWPLDVRLGRMVIESPKHHCLNELLVLAAGLSIQDPRERPMDASAAADEKHSRFEDEQSDFVALLKLWDYLKKERKQRSANQFRKMCRQEFLNWQRVNEWFDLKRQLLQQAREEKLPFNRKPAEFEAIHQSLLAGMLSHVGHKDPEDNSYIGTRSRTFHIFPGSGLFKQRPQWLMASEIVETSRTWARTNAVIEPEWIEKQAAHLLKNHYYDPHWSRKQGRVLAWEQVSLFGLVLFEKRRVNYSRIDPQEARKIFITGALVQGELDLGRASRGVASEAENTKNDNSNGDDASNEVGFLRNNRQIREEIEEMEHKRRKHDVMADESALFEFFDARIPEVVCDSISFTKWLKQLGEQGRQQLYISHDVLLQDEAGAAPQDLYPDRLKVGVLDIPLTYQFIPGDEADGVTLSIALERLNTLDEGQLQWLVPGLLRDKIIALLKNLPKPKRRALTPVPQFADAALERLLAGEGQEAGKQEARKQEARNRGAGKQEAGKQEKGAHSGSAQTDHRLAASRLTGNSVPLLPALANALKDISGIDFEVNDFDESQLDDHLRFRIEVTDDNGKSIAVSRSLAHLQEQYGQKAKRKFMDQLGKASQRDGEVDWVFGDLSVSELSEDGSGQTIKSWPAVVDQKDLNQQPVGRNDTAQNNTTQNNIAQNGHVQQDTVGLRSFDTAEEAATEHYHGVLRLLTIQLQSKIRDLRKNHGLSAAGKLAWSTVGSLSELAENLVDGSVALVAGTEPMKVRSQAAFEKLLARCRSELGLASRQQASNLDKTLRLWSVISAILNDEYAGLRPVVYADMRSQLDDMVYDGFLHDLDPQRLRHYPRYLEAMQVRLQSIDKDPHRDADRMQQVSLFWDQYLQLLQDGREYDEAVDNYRWLIEEFRVSLFAQQLGTASKVSVQRLKQAWKKIQ